jgi:hypothetical protein
VQSQGPSTDSQNNPVIDPTENVLSLVEAAIRRQDDLRAAEARLHRSEVQHLKEIAELERKHATEIRQAETNRIDAIRAVDVGAVNRAAEVASAQAQNLATQLITTAEAMRVQVAAAAQQAQTGLVAALEPIQKDVSELRQVQFQQQGERVARVDDRLVQRDTREERVTDRNQSNWQVSAAIALGTLILGMMIFIAARMS